MLNKTYLGLIGVVAFIVVAVVAVIVITNDDGDDDATTTNTFNTVVDNTTDDGGMDLSAANSGNFDDAMNDVDSGAGNDPFGPIVVELPQQEVAAGQGALLIDVQMPEGYKLNALAPFTAEITVDGESVAVPDTWASYSEVTPILPLVVPMRLSEGQATVSGELAIYWCEAINEELCFVDRAEITIPVTVVAEGSTSDITAPVVLVPPVVN